MEKNNCVVCGNIITSPYLYVQSGDKYYHDECWENNKEELELEIDKETVLRIYDKRYKDQDLTFMEKLRVVGMPLWLFCILLIGCFGLIGMFILGFKYVQFLEFETWKTNNIPKNPLKGKIPEKYLRQK